MLHARNELAHGNPRDEVVAFASHGSGASAGRTPLHAPLTLQDKANSPEVCTRIPEAASHTRDEMTGFREYALACTRDFDATARTRDEFVHPHKLAVGVLRERASCGRSRLVCTRAAFKKDIMRPICLQSCRIESTARVTHPGTPYISRYTPARSWSHAPLSATQESNLRNHANWARVCTRCHEPLHTPWTSLQPSENRGLAYTRSFEAAARTWFGLTHPHKLGAGVLHWRGSRGENHRVCTQNAPGRFAIHPRYL